MSDMPKQPWLRKEERFYLKEAAKEDGEKTVEVGNKKELPLSVGDAENTFEDDEGRVLAKVESGGALIRSEHRRDKSRLGRPSNELREIMQRSLAEALPDLIYLLSTQDLTVSDRLKIMEFLAKYGLGQRKEGTESAVAIKAKVLMLPELEK